MDSNKLIIGILAHVDSGKTTLAEALLYRSGLTKELGRVDHKNTYLDTHELERLRGITIFSKQAELEFHDKKITLLDTPGHVDFSSEMERSVRLMDYAILVISATTGIAGHTHTLIRLLDKYKIPVFYFVNKMDQIGVDKDEIKSKMIEKIGTRCIDFTPSENSEDREEEIALTSEVAMDTFLEKGEFSNKQISNMIKNREIFPCFYGSALKLDGVDELIEGIKSYTEFSSVKEEKAAIVYKISRDHKGNRLTHLKVTGGSIKLKDKIVKYRDGTLIWEDKIDQIRIYSGEDFQIAQEVRAGEICTVIGLDNSEVGQGIGLENDWESPQIEPIMMYQLKIKDDISVFESYEKLKKLAQEEPALNITINEKSKKIQIKVMGGVQIEILEKIICDRFQIPVKFEDEEIIYKETIREATWGIGHYEPLKHYAEVHLLLEPLENGSGIIIENKCKVDDFPLNWQNLVLTHLHEIKHTGVLIGAVLTDIKVSLIAGAGHEKHTASGDFREATYRALKNALMRGKGRILEPMYKCNIIVPMEMVGKVLSDFTMMLGEVEDPIIENGEAKITGRAPVSRIKEYPQEVIRYTKGYGQCSLTLDGYKEMEDQEEIISRIEYNIYEEGIFTPDSVFCSKGSGYNVNWKEVEEKAHIQNQHMSDARKEEQLMNPYDTSSLDEITIDQEEINEIISREYKNSGKKKIPYKSKEKETVYTTPKSYKYQPIKRKEELLLVDGYNIIFAWDELKELAQINLESATGKLLEILSNYQGLKQNKIIVVFDAYKVIRRENDLIKYHNITAIYTKQAQSADGYIEKASHILKSDYEVVVATSDVVEQLIVMGQGARKMSAKQLFEEVMYEENMLRKEHIVEQKNEKINTLADLLNKL